MIGDLREQALQRMKQFEPSESSSSNMTTEDRSSFQSFDTSTPSPPIKNNLNIFLEQLGIDRDRIILLIVLTFLYFDHAEPKILLTILYLML